MQSPKSIALSVGLSAAIVYLAASAVTGRQGLVSYMHLQEREQALLTERAALAKERVALEGRIQALATGSLDLDALEEQARHQFAAAHPDEIIFDLAQSELPQAPSAKTP